MNTKWMSMPSPVSRLLTTLSVSCVWGLNVCPK
jgi:hypothetical protein